MRTKPSPSRSRASNTARRREPSSWPASGSLGSGRAGLGSEGSAALLGLARSCSPSTLEYAGDRPPAGSQTAGSSGQQHGSSCQPHSASSGSSGHRRGASDASNQPHRVWGASGHRRGAFGSSGSRGQAHGESGAPGQRRGAMGSWSSKTPRWALGAGSSRPDGEAGWPSSILRRRPIARGAAGGAGDRQRRSGRGGGRGHPRGGASGRARGARAARAGARALLRPRPSSRRASAAPGPAARRARAHGSGAARRARGPRSGRGAEDEEREPVLKPEPASQAPARPP